MINDDLPSGYERFNQRTEQQTGAQAIARRAGCLRFDYARKGIALSLPDVLIAATALENELILITDNRKHFPMPELRVYPYSGGKRTKD